MQICLNQKFRLENRSKVLKSIQTLLLVLTLTAVSAGSISLVDDVLAAAGGNGIEITNSDNIENNGQQGNSKSANNSASESAGNQGDQSYQSWLENLTAE